MNFIARRCRMIGSMMPFSPHVIVANGRTPQPIFTSWKRNVGPRNKTGNALGMPGMRFTPHRCEQQSRICGSGVSSLLRSIRVISSAQICNRRTRYVAKSLAGFPSLGGSSLGHLTRTQIGTLYWLPFQARDWWRERHLVEIEAIAHLVSSGIVIIKRVTLIELEIAIMSFRSLFISNSR